MDSTAGRILIVDDDAALLRVMDRYLSRLGYRVDACRSAAEAWTLVEANPSQYAGALVDLNLNMPGMRGEELARRILDSNASIRLVVMSGYPTGWSGETLEGNRVGFLYKPFAPQELADALK
jgi:two-component system cell cycle sensor histidine kinase/response regulator CckA